MFTLIRLPWTFAAGIGKLAVTHPRWVGVAHPFFKRSEVMAAAPGVRRSELGDALHACRSAFIGVGVMSCMINLLYLTGSLFMLEVYDRVLPSRSVPTLVGLAILAGGLYIAQGVLDLIRGRILGRIGNALDETLSGRVFD